MDCTANATWPLLTATSDDTPAAARSTLPLLASLNGLCRARVYTAAWASMAALFYMAYAMVEYISGKPSLAVDLCLGASIAMFVGTVVFAKWDAREREAQGPGG